MAKPSLMQRLARWHIWLGWIAGAPVLIWTVTGLFMVLRPIEQVRGTDLRAQRPVLSEAERFAFPEVKGAAVVKIALMQRADRPVWVIERVDGSISCADARSGRQLVGIDAPLARRIADAALKAPPRKATLRRFEADANPIDLRRGRPAWQVHYEDGTNVYVDADSGEVLAVRTRWWRAYDFMWGLHILDPMGRENTSHPLLIGAAALGLATGLLGSVLLFRRRKAAR